MSKNNSMIVVSACLAGEACRYDGKHKLNQKVVDLINSGQAIAICPELLAGLSIPRSPADVIDGQVLEKDGKDVTKIYQKGAQMAEEFCSQFNIAKAILKKGSPSCGEEGVFAKLLKVKGIDIEYWDKT